MSSLLQPLALSFMTACKLTLVLLVLPVCAVPLLQHEAQTACSRKWGVVQERDRRWGACAGLVKLWVGVWVRRVPQQLVHAQISY